MNARRLLWALTLAIPLLLAWIVVAGEINRHADRSAGVHVLVKADRVDETAFSAPRLTMHDPLLESRPVESGFHAGQDVFLRYDNKEGQWVFDKARPKTGEPVWSAAAIDVPARVVIERAGALTAEPLLPDEFAISRATMARLKRETMLDLTLHKGALGTVWVSDAFESALPLGKVVAILPPREGESPVLVGDVPASVAGWSYVPGKSTGWIAQIDEGQIGISKDFDGQPLDAVALPQGIAVAMRPSSRSLAMAGESAERFAIRFGDRVASYQGEFHVFDDDGSFWSVQSLPFPSGLQKRLIKRSIEGVVRNEIAVDGQIGGAASDTFLINDGYEVHRYAIDGSKAVLKDSWTIEGMIKTCVTPSLIVAAGREGVFGLKPGDKLTTKLLAADKNTAVELMTCARNGDVVVSLKPQPTAAEHSPRARLVLIRADGTQTRLSEEQTESEYQQHSEARLLRIGGRLYFGGDGEILVFDLGSGKRVGRITGRRIDHPMRVL